MRFKESKLLSQIRKLEAKLNPVVEAIKEMDEDLLIDPTVGPPDNSYMKNDRQQSDWQSKPV